MEKSKTTKKQPHISFSSSYTTNGEAGELIQLLQGRLLVPP